MSLITVTQALFWGKFQTSYDFWQLGLYSQAHRFQGTVYIHNKSSITAEIGLHIGGEGWTGNSIENLSPGESIAKNYIYAPPNYPSLPDHVVIQDSWHPFDDLPQSPGSPCNVMVPVVAYPVAGNAPQTFPLFFIEEYQEDGEDKYRVKYVKTLQFTAKATYDPGYRKIEAKSLTDQLPSQGDVIKLNNVEYVVYSVTPHNPGNNELGYFTVETGEVMYDNDDDVSVSGTFLGDAESPSRAEAFTDSPLFIGQDAYGFKVTNRVANVEFASSVGEAGVVGGISKQEFEEANGGPYRTTPAINIYIYDPPVVNTTDRTIIGRGRGNMLSVKPNPDGGGRYSTSTPPSDGPLPPPPPKPGNNGSWTGGGYVRSPEFPGGMYTPQEYTWVSMYPMVLEYGDVCKDGFKNISSAIKNEGNTVVQFPIPNFTDPSFVMVVDSGALDPIDPNNPNNPRTITLQPNGQVAVTTYFYPTELQVYSSTASLTNDGETVFTIAATGTGDDCIPENQIRRTIRLDGDIQGDGGINFLEQTVGGTYTRSVKVTNTGNVPVSISSSDIFGGSEELEIANTDISIPVEGSTDIPIYFKPVTTGAKSAVMRLASDATNIDPDGHAYFNVYGVGFSDQIQITREIRFDGSLSFGGELLSNTKDLAFSITSVGTGSVLVKQITVNKPFTFTQVDPRWEIDTAVDGTTTIKVKDASGSISPGTSTQPFVVRFSPTTSGEFSDVLTATVEVTSPPTTHPVDGTGVLDIPDIEEPPDPEAPPPDPDPGSDPPTSGESALDGVGNACISKTCVVRYIYDYKANSLL